MIFNTKLQDRHNQHDQVNAQCIKDLQAVYQTTDLDFLLDFLCNQLSEINWNHFRHSLYTPICLLVRSELSWIQCNCQISKSTKANSKKWQLKPKTDCQPSNRYFVKCYPYQKLNNSNLLLLIFINYEYWQYIIYHISSSSIHNVHVNGSLNI